MGPSSPNAEESAGELVRRRLGDEALEYLVDPLLGGINAGDSDQLSIPRACHSCWRCEIVLQV